MLAFDCYLRISEVCALRVCDLSDVGELVADQGGRRTRRTGLRTGYSDTLVSLAHCKTGNDQSVAIKRPQVASLVRDWAAYVKL